MLAEFANNLKDSLLTIFPGLQTIAVLIIGYYIAKFQFRFQSVHEKRFRVIEDAYAKIKLTNSSFKRLTSRIQSPGDKVQSEQFKDFVDCANGMIEFLDTKELFFNSNEKVKIKTLRDKFIETWGEYHFKEFIATDPGMIKEKMASWQKVLDSTEKTIPNLIDSLEKEFKKELGLK